MPLPMLPVDKANHMVYGAITFFVGASVGHYVNLPPEQAGLALSAIVGALKEAADAYGNYKTTGDPMQGPHGVEFLDFAATTTGGFVCFAAAVFA